MASALDVAQYILAERGEMTAMKLQKLVYYSQAWSLVWDEAPLFHEQIRAWANGPVVKELYAAHAGKFTVAKIPGGRVSNLTKRQKNTIDVVLAYYGKRAAQWLSDLTHMERPWKSARGALKPGESGDAVISLSSMAEYYGSLGPAVKG